MTQNHFNVIVVGAGISGISAGYHLQKRCPDQSFAILEIAGERGIPCIAARAIFDEAAFELPRGLESIPGPDGSPRLRGVIKLLLRRPWSIPRLYALRSRSVRAAASLAAFVAGTLRRLEGTGKDA